MHPACVQWPAGGLAAAPGGKITGQGITPLESKLMPRPGNDARLVLVVDMADRRKLLDWLATVWI